jgi:hypothetical protein
MELKNFISKEVYKTYYGECKKIGVAMASTEILKKMWELEKEKEITFLKLGYLDDKIKTLDEPDEDVISAPVNPLVTFYEYFMTHNEDGSYDEKIEELKQMLSDEEVQTEIISTRIVDGNEFGEAVRAYYTLLNQIMNAKEGTSLEILDLKSYSYKDALKKTDEVFKGPHKYRFIFESAFTIDDKLRIRPDVLEWHGENRISVFEAKASTYNVDKTDGQFTRHYLDLAYQLFVLKKQKFVVYDAGLILINGDYVRGSENYENDPEFSFRESAANLKEWISLKLTTLERALSVVEKVKNEGVFPAEEPKDLEYERLIFVYKKNKKGTPLLELLQDRVLEMEKDLTSIDNTIIKLLNSDTALMLFFEELGECFGASVPRSGDTLNFKTKVCTNIFPYIDFNRPHILNVLGPSDAAAFILKYQYFYLDDFDDEECLKFQKDTKSESFFFPPIKALKRNRILAMHESGIEPSDSRLVIDATGMEDMLSEYVGPIYMYDFETSSWAIPQFNDHVSYDQTVFQYSIHVLESNEDIATKAYEKNHYAWLKKGKEDPRPEFIENFIRDAFSHGPGTYVSYNKSFEIGVLRKLSVLFPIYSAPLLYICQNTIDLWDFFKFNHIYHPNFHRSTSIKYTQPTLYPDLQYTDLVVNKGDKASYLFREYIDNLLGEDSERLWKKVHYDSMLAYCNRDTEAMIVLYKRILEIWSAYKEKYNEK